MDLDLDLLLEPLPPDAELRQIALAVLRCAAHHPGTSPATRAEAVGALHKADDQLFALIEAAGQLGEAERRELVAAARDLAAVGAT